MKLAVIGGGVSGLVCGYLLHDVGELTLFEAAPELGGHAHTIDVSVGGRRYPVDTGFVVFNERNYPNFTRLLSRLGVATHGTTMSFSVRDDERNVEYGTHAVRTLLRQPHAWFHPELYRMVRDVWRFRREIAQHGDDETLTLGELLDRGGYDVAFLNFVILPVSATIWSCAPEQVRAIPLALWWRFMQNHGLLDILDAPRWLFVEGGSRQYVRKLVAPFARQVRAATPVERVTRRDDGVWVTPRGGAAERFDEVVMAVHSDQALAMLDPPTALEHEILSAMPYRDNRVQVHSDCSVLPNHREAWSSWNYLHQASSNAGPTVSYNMNILHQLAAPRQLCVSLNLSGVQRESVLAELSWAHPVVSQATHAAQQRRAEVSGVDRIHYCGAYWGLGFHEDGVVSALRVAERFQRHL